MGDNPGTSNIPLPPDQPTTQLAMLTVPSYSTTQPGSSTQPPAPVPVSTSNYGPPVQVSTFLTVHVKPPEHATHLDNIPTCSTSLLSTNGQQTPESTPLETHVSTMATITLSSDSYTGVDDVTRAKPPPAKRKRALSCSSLDSNISNSTDTDSGTEGYSTPQLQLLPSRTLSANPLYHVNSDITPHIKGRRTAKCLRRTASEANITPIRSQTTSLRTNPFGAPQANIKQISSYFKPGNTAPSTGAVSISSTVATTDTVATSSQLLTPSTDHSMTTVTTGATSSPPTIRTTLFNRDVTIITHSGITPIPSILPITTYGPTITMGTRPVPIITLSTPQGADINPVSTHVTNTTTNTPTATTNTRRVAFQLTPTPFSTFTQNATSTSTLTQNALSVSLQDDGRVIAPRAEEMWRKARNNMSGELKARARMAHLQKMIRQDIVPPWALGLECIPGYLLPGTDAIVERRHMHAREILRTATDELEKMAKQFDHTAKSYLQACETNYGADQNGWAIAKQRLANLIGTEKAEIKTTLEKRLDVLKETPIKDEDISDYIFRRLPQSNFTRTLNRRRDFSPQPSTSRDDDDRESYRGRENTRYPSPSNRNRGRGRGRGRSPRSRSRSSSRSSRGRGSRGNPPSNRRQPLQDSRPNNYNSRPTSDYNNRSNNGRPNYNPDRPRGQENDQRRRNSSPRNQRGPRNRQDNLSSAEQALIQALRNAKQ